MFIRLTEKREFLLKLIFYNNYCTLTFLINQDKSIAYRFGFLTRFQLRDFKNHFIETQRAFFSQLISVMHIFLF